MPAVQAKTQKQNTLARRVHEYAVSLLGQGLIRRLSELELRDPSSFSPSAGPAPMFLMQCDE